MCAVLASYFAATAIVMAPVALHPASRLLGGPGDATGAIRDFWTARRQHRTLFTLKRDLLEYAPEGYPRIPAIAVANAAEPLAFMAVRPLLGDLASWNLFLLLGPALTALAVWLLLEGLGLARLPAYAGGLLFGLAPWQVAQAVFGHPSLIHLWPVVAAVALATRLPASRRYAVATGAAVAAASYMHSYLGVIAVAGVAAAAVATSFGGRALLVVQRAALAGAVTLALLVPVAVAGIVEPAPTTTALANSPHDYTTLAWRDFLTPSARSVLWGWTGDGAVGERAVFVGYAVLLLAAAAVALGAVRRRHPLAVRLGAALVVVGVLCALPADLSLGPVPLPTPARLGSHVTTGFDVWLRFAVLTMLGLVVLAGAALSQFWESRRRALAVAAAAFAVLEIVPAPLPSFTPPAATVVDRWLARHPEGIVADYPMMGTTIERSIAFSDYSSLTIYAQVHHHHPLYAAWNRQLTGSRVEAIRLATADLDDLGTPGVLAAEGVRYVVVHADAYRSIGVRVPQLARPTFAPILRSGDTTLYALHAQPTRVADVVAQHAAEVAAARFAPLLGGAPVSGFYGPESRNGATWRWMRTEGDLKVDTSPLPSTLSLRYRITFHAFSNHVPRTLAVEIDHREVGRLTIATFDREYAVSTPPLDSGHDVDVRLVASPGAAPLGGGDDREGSVYMTDLVLTPLPY